MSKGLIVVAVLVLILLAVGGQYIGVRNTLVTKNESVKAAWSQVDIVLQRRADLIPNLVNTVKGYAQQEVTVFGDIANARARLLSANTPQDKIAANGQLDGAIGRLLAISENYPQLKSNENFLRLQDELAGTENRIAVERKRYNDTLAGLQHLRPAIPQQPLCRIRWIQSEPRILRSFRGFKGGADGELQQCSGHNPAARTRPLMFPQKPRVPHPSRPVCD